MVNDVSLRKRDILDEPVSDSYLNLDEMKVVGIAGLKSAVWPGWLGSEALLNDKTVKPDSMLERDLAALPLNETPYRKSSYDDLATGSNKKSLDERDFLVEEGFTYSMQNRSGCATVLSDTVSACVQYGGAFDQMVESDIMGVGWQTVLGITAARGAYGASQRYRSIRTEKEIDRAKEKCAGPIRDHKHRVNSLLNSYKD